MTFLDLKKRLARRTGKNAASLDPITDARLSDFLNEAHHEVLRKAGRESLRYATVQVPSVSGQKFYAVPMSGVARINRITETTNDRKLEFHTPDWLDRVAPDPQTGTPWAWIPRGLNDVHTQPTAAATLRVRSSSAADTTQRLYVEGIRDGGFAGRETAVLTGTTWLEIPTVVDFISITKCYLDTAPAGLVTITAGPPGGPPGGAPGSTIEVTAMQPGTTRTAYTVLQLYPTPSAALLYTCDVLRDVPDMVQPGDEPLLPYDFHDVLLPLALLREFTKADDPRRWETTRAEARTGLSALDTFLNAHPDWRPTWGAPEDRHTTLGPWTPVGS